jgi:peptide/nickel transport system ATP-binding protein
VNFTIRSGETFGLVGESGCGKSTIGKLVVGLEKPTGGSINFEGKDLAKSTARNNDSAKVCRSDRWRGEIK